MPPTDYDDMRRWLANRRLLLEDVINTLRERESSSTDTDSADELVDTVGNEATAELLMVRAALYRIDVGEYGRCVQCTGEISEERLRTRPYALLCNDCKAAQIRSRNER